MSIFIAEIFIGVCALAGIIALSKANNLTWIPVIGFIAGFLFSADPSYHFSNAFGGLTFGFLVCLIASFWLNRKNKKSDNDEDN